MVNFDEILAESPYLNRSNAKESTMARDSKILAAIAKVPVFTTVTAAELAGGPWLQHPAGALIRALLAEGWLVRVSPPGSKPISYEWKER